MPYVRKKLSKTEIENLTQKQQRDLKMLSLFYFDSYKQNSEGIVTKPTPRQFLNFVEKFHETENPKEFNPLPALTSVR